MLSKNFSCADCSLKIKPASWYNSSIVLVLYFLQYFSDGIGIILSIPTRSIYNYVFKQKIITTANIAPSNVATMSFISTTPLPV